MSDEPLRLVYLFGEPGVGKTTLMRHLTRGWARRPLPGQPARDLLADPRGQVAVELGKQRGVFSGTDALPMDAVVHAERWVLAQAEREARLILAEGARLANRRFLAAAQRGGWAVTLVYLYASAAAAERRAARAAGGKPQDPAWVRGAATRARNLANDPPPGAWVVQLDAARPTAALAAEVAGLWRLPA